MSRCRLSGLIANEPNPPLSPVSPRKANLRPTLCVECRGLFWRLPMSKYTGVWVPAALAVRTDLSQSEKLLLGYSMSFTDRCFASDEHIGQALGISAKTVANLLSDLRKKGIMTGRNFPKSGTTDFPKSGSQTSRNREHREKRDKSRDISTDFPKPGKPVSTGKYDIHHPFHPLNG